MCTTYLILLRRAARGGVGNCPSGFLPNVEISSPKQLNDLRDNVRLDDHLDLLRGARGNVGNGPAGLLDNALAGRVEQVAEAVECSRVDDYLCLFVVARDNVPDSAQRRRLHRVSRVHEELHKSRDNAALNHGLDLVVLAVAEVRERPAAIGQNVVVAALGYEFGEDWQSRRYDGKVRRRLTPAKVRERPRRVAEHGGLLAGLELLEQQWEGARGEHHVPTLARVTGDVAKGPDGLLPHVGVGRTQELGKDGHGARLDNDARVVRGAGCNVRQGPGRLELQLVALVLPDEFNKAGHHARADHFLDGGVSLDGEQLAEFHRGRETGLGGRST